MEFLEPKLERSHRIRLFIGYGIVAIAIAITSLVLLYYSYGYSIDRKGSVLQSGLVFVSSTPGNASVGILENPGFADTTDSRISLKSGHYTITLNKAGYRPWQRQITVMGSDVQRIDYPRLFASDIARTDALSFNQAPELYSQSPSRKWLMIKQPGESVYGVVDLREPKTPRVVTYPLTVVPAIADPGSPETWQPIEWGKNDRTVLIERSYVVGGNTQREYLLIDRVDPARNQSLNVPLGLSQTDKLSLFNKSVDQFYIHNLETNELRTARLNGTPLQPPIANVKAFKAINSRQLLYVTTGQPKKGSLETTSDLIMKDGDKLTTIRRYPAAANQFLLDYAHYDNSDYIVTSANTESGVFIYRNVPLDGSNNDVLPKPFRKLALVSPTKIAFSKSSRYLLANNKDRSVVFDVKNIETKRINPEDSTDTTFLPLGWMDDSRLMTYANNNVVVSDYDGLNRQLLVSQSSNFSPSFSPDYSYLFGVEQRQDKFFLVGSRLITE